MVNCDNLIIKLFINNNLTLTSQRGIFSKSVKDSFATNPGICGV